MTTPITEEQVILRFGKMVAAHIISSIYHYEQFQDVAVEMLSLFIIETIKALASRVKEILSLQKRTIPNSLHLLLIAQHIHIPLPAIYTQLTKKKIKSAATEFLVNVGRRLFNSHTLEKVNQYQKEGKHSNIRYIPAIFTVNTMKPLPRKKQIYQLFKVIEKNYSNSLLEAYTMLSYLNASVIQIIDDGQTSIPAQTHQKDIVRQRYAASNKINKKFANFMHGDGKQRRMSSKSKVVIALDPDRPGISDNVANLNATGNKQDQELIIIDASE